MDQTASNIESLLSKVPNRFVLAVGAARRGRQLLEGANPLIAVANTPPVLAALAEINKEKVVIEMAKKDEDA
jgi:DNA-directed RNA polymerase omega subunit